MAKGARDNQIGAERVRRGLQRVGDRLWRDIIDPGRVSRDAMSPEMLHDKLFGQSVVRVDKA